MKCYLSGMPELRLGLNDKVMFESTGRSESFVITLSLLPILTPQQLRVEKL
jgi:AP-1 complex subunit mu